MKNTKRLRVTVRTWHTVVTPKEVRIESIAHLNEMIMPHRGNGTCKALWCKPWQVLEATDEGGQEGRWGGASE